MNRSVWMQLATCGMAFALAHCGGAKPATTATVGAADPGAPASEVASDVDAGAAAPERAAQKSADLPKACASRDGELCLPDPGFVKRLCNGSFPDVALSFFAGGTVWTRGYLTRDVDGWNAEGGAAARAKLFFDEEVIVLRRRAPPAAGGIQVGSGAGFLVLRVDGSCYTLDDVEMTFKRPPKPKSGPVTFRYLDAKVQEALLKNPRIEAAANKRRKECKGVTSGVVSKACEQADIELTRAVPEEVRKGMELPTPGHVP